MITITPAEFERMVKFVHSNYGINLSQKKHIIEGRLSGELMAKGFKNYTEYLNVLERKNPQDIDHMLNRVTTNHTFFMRENSHFSFFQDTILPYLAQVKTDRSLAVWSAGCSSGEEPYTLSIIMKEFFGNQATQWDTRVLATDISQRALELAMAGSYQGEALKDVPEKWKNTYFTKQGDKYVVTKGLRDSVIFKTFNLMDQIHFKTKFDVIFCRNVMIYFDGPTKDGLVNRFYDATRDGGYLLIGHSETLNKEAIRYKYVMPATYRKTQ